LRIDPRAIAITQIDKGSRKLRTAHQRISDRANSLANWENEGGALESSWVDGQIERADAADTELEVLRCLGAGVAATWNELPSDVKRSIFRHATSDKLLCGTIKLREQIARFLHARAVEGRAPKNIPTGDN
jgi:hypothetical protein